MASSCKYGARTEMIRYRIVLNWDPRGKAPILRLRKEEEYNLDKTLGMCWSNEAAIKQPDSMKHKETQTDEQVNAVGADQAKRTNKGRKKERYKEREGSKEEFQRMWIDHKKHTEDECE